MVATADDTLAWMPPEFRAHGGWEYHADRHEDRGPSNTIIQYTVLGWGTCSCGAEFGTQWHPLPPSDVSALYEQHLPQGFRAWQEAWGRWRLDQIREHPYRLPGWPPVGWDDDPQYSWR